MKLEFVRGETDNILYSGEKIRRHTVLIRIGRISMSKKAFLLGASLVLCQVLDGILTYVGLSLMGIHMEGNQFLQALMHAYGAAPVLALTKFLAVLIVVGLTFEAHRRRWIRPIIFGLTIIYLFLAVLPWIFIIGSMEPETIPSVVIHGEKPL